MATRAHVVLRAVYVLIGVAVIGVSIAESSARATLYVPILFGILLIVQGVSGA